MPNNPLHKQWGERLRDERKAQGLSLRQLAAKTGQIHFSQISRIELGTSSASDDLRFRLAAALGKQVHELFPYPDTAVNGERVA